MIDIVPRHQLGYMVPVLVSDAIHHQFYQLMPSNCAFVCKPLDLKSFTREGALGAIDAFWPAFDFLVERGVDRISQGGIPVSAPVGRRPVHFRWEGADDTPVYRRDALKPGHRLAGPAVIEQLDATTLLYPGDTLTVDAAGSLLVEVNS